MDAKECNDEVIIGDGKTLRATKIGIQKFMITNKGKEEKITLQVTYVPGMKYNLFSITRNPRKSSEFAWPKALGCERTCRKYKGLSLFRWNFPP